MSTAGSIKYIGALARARRYCSECSRGGVGFSNGIVTIEFVFGMSIIFFNDLCDLTKKEMLYTRATLNPREINVKRLSLLYSNRLFTYSYECKSGVSTRYFCIPTRYRHTYRKRNTPYIYVVCKRRLPAHSDNIRSRKRHLIVRTRTYNNNARVYPHAINMQTSRRRDDHPRACSTCAEQSYR